MHELLAAGHALHLETRKQKKLVCVPALPVLGARSCSQVSPITGVFTVAPGLVSPLGEEDCTQPFIWTQGDQLIFERESLAQVRPGEQCTYTKWNGYEQRCGEILKTSQGSQTHKGCTRASWRCCLTHEPKGFGAFSHILSKLHNHRDNRYIGLDVCLYHFSWKGEFHPHEEMFPK